MGNGMERSMSMRQKTRSALERIETLEQTIPQIVSSLNEVMGQNDQRLSQLAEILEAVVEQVGKDAVDATIEVNRKRKIEDATAQAKLNLEKGLVEGRLVKAETVSDKSLLVGVEFDKEGKALHPGRVQLTIQGVKPEFRTKLLGQKVGFEFTLEATSGKFVLQEVYEFVEKPAAPAPNPEVAAAEVAAVVPAQG